MQLVHLAQPAMHIIQSANWNCGFGVPPFQSAGVSKPLAVVSTFESFFWGLGRLEGGKGQHMHRANIRGRQAKL
eukprot:4569434-Amphidinium_carterae.1